MKTVKDKQILMGADFAGFHRRPWPETIGQK